MIRPESRPRKESRIVRICPRVVMREPRGSSLRDASTRPAIGPATEPRSVPSTPP